MRVGLFRILYNREKFGFFLLQSFIFEVTQNFETINIYSEKLPFGKKLPQWVFLFFWMRMDLFRILRNPENWIF